MLENTNSFQSIPALCRTLRGQPPIALSCIHLENVSLSGKGLLMVVCALKANMTIKVLQPHDQVVVGNYVIGNATINREFMKGFMIRGYVVKVKHVLT